MSLSPHPSLSPIPRPVPCLEQGHRWCPSPPLSLLCNLPFHPCLTSSLPPFPLFVREPTPLFVGEPTPPSHARNGSSCLPCRPRRPMRPASFTYRPHAAPVSLLLAINLPPPSSPTVAMHATSSATTNSGVTAVVPFNAVPPSSQATSSRATVHGHCS